MTQSCWKAFARTLGVLAALALFVGTPALRAQATGKLEGHVTDPQGQPIPNATVLIPGTAFTAPTNAQGYYFIENIPAGSYSVRAQYVGYRPHETLGQRILSGQTITLDFTLEQAPVTVQNIVVTEQATNPLVPRDQVTSKDIVTGAMVSKLPVDRVTAALSMQAGVVQVTNCGTNGACSTSFSVRGSRTSEQATYVDGVPIQSAISSMVGSAPSLGLAVNAFEDASITTGAASSEFSSAQGGIINLTTRTGGSKLNGNLGYETAELGGQKYGQGYNVFYGSVGGPVMHNLTFFLQGRLEGTNSNNQGYQGYLYPAYQAVRIDTTFRLPVTSGSATSDSTDVNVYDYADVQGACSSYANVATANQSQRAQDMRNNYGSSCNRTSGTPRRARRTIATAKLNYSFGQGSRFAASYLFSGTQSRGTLADGAASGSQTGSNVAILNWTQTIFRKATHQLSVDAYLSWQWNNSLNSDLTVASEQATRSSPLGIITHKLQFNVNPSDAPVDSTLIYNFLLQKTTSRIGMTDSKNTNQYNGQGSFMPNASCPVDPVGCAAGGGGAFGNEYGMTYDVENQLIGKVDFDWQIDRYNRMKIGGLFTNWQQLTNFTNSSVGGNDFTGKPTNRSAYAEDRLDLGDVVLVGGVRYDYYWSKAYHWNEFPDISTRPGFTPDSLFCPDGATPSATAACALIQDPSHHYVSPHVQVAFPVTPTTNFRLSYSQAVQAPDFGLIYENALTDINTGGAEQPVAVGFGPRLRQDDQVRVRCPARLQPRHGAGRGGVQQRQRGQPVDQVHLSDRSADRGADPYLRGAEHRLRQRPRDRIDARPPDRQLLQRPARLHVRERGQHRDRSDIVHQLLRAVDSSGYDRRTADGGAGDRHLAAAEPRGAVHADAAARLHAGERGRQDPPPHLAVRAGAVGVGVAIYGVPPDGRQHDPDDLAGRLR